MRKSKIFAIGLLLFIGLQLIMAIPFIQKQNVLADIDTLTLEDDFEEKYYNNIYSQYENVSAIISDDETTFRPSGIGSYWGNTPYGDTPNWECVDEVSADDDATYVAPTGSGEKIDTYDIPDHTIESGEILNVTLYIKAKKSISNGAGQFYLLISGTQLYSQSIPINFAWGDYSYTWTINPYTTVAWTWTDIDQLEIGVGLENLGGSPRCTQVYAIIHYEPSVSIGETTIHKKQETSYYRAYGGLYSYLHNVTRISTMFEELIQHNSSIIINFVSLNVFPQALVFFLYFNCFYNVSLFIGTDEYVLKTHNYSINDWKYIDIRLDRRDYLITDLNADFYIKIYPIENNNTHDVFYIDNLKVKYTDPEQAIGYSNWCLGGDEYNDWVDVNDTSASFYAIGTGENPAGWLEDGTSDIWAYRTASNKIMSRGMTIHNSWTLHDWETDNNLIIFTDIHFTTDKDYYIQDVTYFYNNAGGGLSSVNRHVKLYIDDVWNRTISFFSSISDSSPTLDEYYDLSHTIELTQLNEHTMQYASSFANLYTNITDWRPLIFSINEDIQVGLNIMNYAQQTQYEAKPSTSTNPIIFQKTSVDIHNTPISDFTIPDIEGGFFRTIWDRLQYYMGRTEGVFGLQWQALNLERAYRELMVDMMSDLIEGVDNPDWLDNYYQDIQDIQDTYAGGLVSTWRNLFSNDDYSGLENRFDNRWGGMFGKATQGEDSFFTRMFGRIFGEDVGFIPQLIWAFFGNFINWIVIFFIMFLVMFMRAIMKRDYDKVKGIVSGSISVILFIVQVVKWFISFIIRILTMIGGFIPFT